MTVAHFVVSGEFITEQARSLWNDEDEPEKAMNLLRCLHGISEAQCLEILEGKAKLVGDSDSGVTLTSDNVRGKSLTQIINKLKAERNEAQDERADLVQMAIGDTVNVASPTGLREIPRRKSFEKTTIIGTLPSAGRRGFVLSQSGIVVGERSKRLKRCLIGL